MLTDLCNQDRQGQMDPSKLAKTDFDLLQSMAMRLHFLEHSALRISVTLSKLLKDVRKNQDCLEEILHLSSKKDRTIT